MNEVLTRKIKQVVEGNAKAREIVAQLGIGNGGNTRESQERAVNFAFPDLILSFFENPFAKQMEAMRQDMGVDPIKDLVSCLKQTQETLRPVLTEEQDNALTCAGESINYFYNLSEQTKLFLAALYVQGFIQPPVQR